MLTVYWLTAIPYWIGWRIVNAYMAAKWHVRVVNAHLVPTEGPVILVANHLNVVDSPLIALTAGIRPRRVTFLAKSDYFDMKSLKGIVVTLAFKSIGQISLHRTDQTKYRQALAKAIDISASGEVIGIHVEGTRSPDGRLYKARSGFAHIAKSANATIVPVALQYLGDNPYSSQPTVRVIYGDPIPYEVYKDMFPIILAQHITSRIQALSGQELAEEFAVVSS